MSTNYNLHVYKKYQLEGESSCFNLSQKGGKMFFFSFQSMCQVYSFDCCNHKTPHIFQNSLILFIFFLSKKNPTFNVCQRNS